MGREKTKHSDAAGHTYPQAFSVFQKVHKKSQAAPFFNPYPDSGFSHKGSYFPKIIQIHAAPAYPFIQGHIPTLNALIAAQIEKAFHIAALKPACQITAQPPEYPFHSQHRPFIRFDTLSKQYVPEYRLHPH